MTRDDADERQMFVAVFGEAEVQRAEQVAFIRGLFSPFADEDEDDASTTDDAA